VNLTDQLGAVVAILVAEHVEGGKATVLRLKRWGVTSDSTSKLAKLCGATPQQVTAWENGTLRPTTGQAIVWLQAIHSGGE